MPGYTYSQIHGQENNPKRHFSLDDQNLLNNQDPFKPTKQLASERIIKESKNEPEISKISNNVGGGDTLDEYEVIRNIQREHNKFTHIMEDKLNYLAPILHWMGTNNMKAVINAVQSYHCVTINHGIFNHEKILYYFY